MNEETVTSQILTILNQPVEKRSYWRNQVKVERVTNGSSRDFSISPKETHTYSESAGILCHPFEEVLGLLPLRHEGGSFNPSSSYVALSREMLEKIAGYRSKVIAAHKEYYAPSSDAQETISGCQKNLEDALDAAIANLSVKGLNQHQREPISSRDVEYFASDAKQVMQTIASLGNDPALGVNERYVVFVHFFENCLIPFIRQLGEGGELSAVLGYLGNNEALQRLSSSLRAYANDVEGVLIEERLIKDTRLYISQKNEKNYAALMRTLQKEGL